MAAEAAPEWVEKRDNAWQLAAATLVGLQSVPGLVILYGGAGKKKWAVNSAFMALYAFAAVLVCWRAWAFRMSFGDELSPPPSAAPTSPASTRRASSLAGASPARAYPAATLLFFQFVFAAITLILVAGSLSSRSGSPSPTPSAPSAYGAPRPASWTSPAASSSTSPPASPASPPPTGYVVTNHEQLFGRRHAWLECDGDGAMHHGQVGPRTEKDREAFPPNNVLLTLAGAGLLWMGWTGFNGGAPYAADADASVAVVNTHLCTATSLLDFFVFGRPSVIGAVQGMITGLVCVTPAAGLVQGWAAMLMGALSGSVPWYTMMVLHKRSRFLARVDDTLAVLHTHGVAGRQPRRRPDGAPRRAAPRQALLRRRPAVTSAGLRQVGVRMAGIAFVVALNVAVTSAVCLAVRVAVPQLAAGDDAIHGEDAYAVWGDGETYEQSVHGGGNNRGGFPMTANPVASKATKV
uniref:Ammonium transporter AmtB-like domain-containing protein n=1 Tax=Oryza meridionalis TaxID=40149 RepID=A0A0E0D6U2_9ORYZ